MSIRRNSVGLPIKGLVERNHDYNQNADMVVKFRDLENKDCRNNEDAAQKQQWHQPQPQVPKRPAIHWENFLPVRSLKVLLVENDDSTRYIVSALLRNCSYEVTAVSNGLEAWETLEDVTNHVDLVLTEVAMPCLSGIDLLYKIMSDKTCKNIPIIMMSSNDSMSVVFKCLSNGAVDFLVKPIRENELKNLWQHVWRKCHGSGGGSGSGMQTENSTKSKSADGSNNDTDLNYEEGNGSTGLTIRNGSDNDSGTQSACSKRALEVHSSQPISQCDDMANLPDSTCAHVIHSRLEAQGSNWVSANATTIIQNEGNEHDDVTMGIDLTLGSPTTSELQFRNPSDEVLAKVSSTGVSKFLDSEIKKDEKKQGKEVVEDNTVTENSDIKRKDNDATVCITNVTLSCGEIVRNELVSDPSKVKHVDLYDGKEPSLELSLQRLRDLGSSSRTTDQTLNILRHSDHSAFSRYNATSTNRQACSSVNCSLEVGKIESMQHLQREISGTQNQGSNGSSNNFDMGSTSNCVSDLHREIRVTPNQGSKGSSNNCDMGSTSNRVSDKPESVDDKPISVHNCHAFQPVRHGHCPSGQTGISDTAKTVTTHGMAMHPTPQIEHHHYHHHHHHVRGLQQQQMSLDSDDLSSGNIIDAAPQCGMSDKLGMGIEGNAANYESASGSNNGSNGLNGRNSIVGGTNVAVDNNTPGACVVVSGNRSAVEHDRLALREAALIKFRQKRKERCFEKKVRYQSRKKLAEQRPRVRGQFVKQTVDDNQKGNKCV